MKKLLVALMVLAFAASAFAVDVKLSGDFTFKGKKIKNNTMLKNNEVDYDYWEQDMNVLAKFMVSKDTFVTVRAAIMDRNFDNTGSDGDTTDDNFLIELAFMTHKFNKMIQLDVGRMTGGAWATAFGNDAGGKDRVKGTFTIPGAGKIVALTQKNKDLGAQNTSTKDSEKDDSDTYFIGYVGKFGPVTVMPAFTLTDDSSADANQTSKGKEFTDFTLAVKGDFGMVGFEGEYQSENTDFDSGVGNDYDVYGFYANVFTKLGMAKVGAIYAYGSTDKSGGSEYGFDFNDDFDTTIVSDQLETLGGGKDVKGMTAFKLYADADVTEKISVSAAVAMLDSNWDTGTWKKYEAYEVDVTAAYSITDALSYEAGVGMLDGSDYSADSGVTFYDPSTVWVMYHALKLSF